MGGENVQGETFGGMCPGGNVLDPNTDRQTIDKRDATKNTQAKMCPFAMTLSKYGGGLKAFPSRHLIIWGTIPTVPLSFHLWCFATTKSLLCDRFMSFK